jgi:hypothetical protein
VDSNRKGLVNAPSASQGQRWGLPILLSLAMGAAAGLLAFLYYFDPATSSYFPQCPTQTYLGLQCPGCGSTRALHQLLNGNFRAAFSLNPVTPLVGPLLAYGVLVEATRHRIGKVRLPPIADRYLWLAGALLVGFGVLRNLL